MDAREPISQPEVVSTSTQQPVKSATGELTGGAQAAIGTGIGVTNVCCSPCCGTPVGLILYFLWQKDKPVTAKKVLTVTLITLGVGIVLGVIGFMLGFMSSFIEAVTENM